MKGQKLTKGSDEQLPNWMKENGKWNEKLTIFTLLYWKYIIHFILLNWKYVHNVFTVLFFFQIFKVYSR